MSEAISRMSRTTETIERERDENGLSIRIDERTDRYCISIAWIKWHYGCDHKL